MAKAARPRAKRASAPEPAASGGKSAAPKRAGRPASRTDEATEVAGVRLTHPERVLWEDQGVTKHDLAEYYLAVAERMLPHVVERPLTLVRCPAGQEGTCFFQKHSWAGLAEHVARATLTSGGQEEVLFVRDIQGVLSLVQAGVLEIHPWGATVADPERPDRMTFDFDPDPDVPWSEVLAGAREVRERLAAQGLESFAKTTGGKGLHVVVPLQPGPGWNEVKAFARALSEAMEADSPGRYLTKAGKAEREGRIFIDYLRNAREATAVAAFSTRARPGAPVSTPLAWDELSDAIRSNHFTVATLPQRLKALRTDPWAGFDRLRQTLPATRSARRGAP